MADVYTTVAGAGAKDGTDWDNAYDETQLQNAADDLTAAGDRWFIEEGTYSVPAVIDLDQGAGIASNRIEMIGVNSSHVEDGTRPIFDCESSIASAFKIASALDFWDFRNFEVINATSNGIDHLNDHFSDALYFYNVISENNGGYGINCGTERIRYSVFENCAFIGNTNHGIFRLGVSGCVFNTQIINNGNDGVRGCAAVSNCVFHGNTTTHLRVEASAGNITGNTFDGTRAGTNTVSGMISGFGGQLVYSNRFTNQSGYAIDGYTLHVNGEDNNYFYANSSGDLNPTGYYVGGKTSRYSGVNSDEGYNDLANDDFSLAADGDGVGVSNPIGAADETTNIGYFTQGMPPAGGAGGAAKLINGGLIN
jgi:hypothetical protein